MVRKIIHIDMDAFFASVEQRDHPEYRGKPIAVGYSGNRGVVMTASYEARKFGVHSAMSSKYAIKLCPNLIFVSSNFGNYSAASKKMREIFFRYT
ncbi:MAG: DNA polymerase IV, partial [Ignavibacteriales bacterium CG_4_9_14_3_um_filter_30_11]